MEGIRQAEIEEEEEYNNMIYEIERYVNTLSVEALRIELTNALMELEEIYEDGYRWEYVKGSINKMRKL